jgi:hypothetical protein
MPDGRHLVPLAQLEKLARRAQAGQAVTLTPASLLLLLDHVATVEAVVALYAGDMCRVCGCTAMDACEGGCSWVEHDGEGPLCSSCLNAAPELIVPPAEGS